MQQKQRPSLFSGLTFLLENNVPHSASVLASALGANIIAAPSQAPFNIITGAGMHGSVNGPQTKPRIHYTWLDVCALRGQLVPLLEGIFIAKSGSDGLVFDSGVSAPVLALPASVWTLYTALHAPPAALAAPAAAGNAAAAVAHSAENMSADTNEAPCSGPSAPHPADATNYTHTLGAVSGWGGESPATNRLMLSDDVAPSSMHEDDGDDAGDGGGGVPYLPRTSDEIGRHCGASASSSQAESAPSTERPHCACGAHTCPVCCFTAPYITRNTHAAIARAPVTSFEYDPICSSISAQRSPQISGSNSTASSERTQRPTAAAATVTAAAKHTSIIAFGGSDDAAAVHAITTSAAPAAAGDTEPPSQPLIFIAEAEHEPDDGLDVSSAVAAAAAVSKIIHIDVANDDDNNNNASNNLSSAHMQPIPVTALNTDDAVVPANLALAAATGGNVASGVHAKLPQRKRRADAAPTQLNPAKKRAELKAPWVAAMQLKGYSDSAIDDAWGFFYTKVAMPPATSAASSSSAGSIDPPLGGAIVNYFFRGAAEKFLSTSLPIDKFRAAHDAAAAKPDGVRQQQQQQKYVLTAVEFTDAANAAFEALQVLNILTSE